MSNQQIGNIVELLRVGQLAMELWRAEQQAVVAKDAYHEQVRQYEIVCNGGHRIKLDPNDSRQAGIIEFTGERYRALQRAKKAVYSAKLKLRRACKAADMAVNVVAAGGAQ